MRSPFFLLTILLAVGPLSAGMVYDFEATHEEPRSVEKITGRIWVDGQRYRAEVKRQGSPVQVLLSYDGDKTAFLLDIEKQTWRARMLETKDSPSSIINHQSSIPPAPLPCDNDG